jgi:hypothetical protein
VLARGELAKVGDEVFGVFELAELAERLERVLLGVGRRRREVGRRRGEDVAVVARGRLERDPADAREQRLHPGVGVRARDQVGLGVVVLGHHLARGVADGDASRDAEGAEHDRHRAGVLLAVADPVLDERAHRAAAVPRRRLEGVGPAAQLLLDRERLVERGAGPRPGDDRLGEREHLLRHVPRQRGQCGRGGLDGSGREGIRVRVGDRRDHLVRVARRQPVAATHRDGGVPAVVQEAVGRGAAEPHRLVGDRHEDRVVQPLGGHLDLELAERRQVGLERQPAARLAAADAGAGPLLTLAEDVEGGQPQVDGLGGAHPGDRLGALAHEVGPDRHDRVRGDRRAAAEALDLVVGRLAEAGQQPAEQGARRDRRAGDRRPRAADATLGCAPAVHARAPAVQVGPAGGEQQPGGGGEQRCGPQPRRGVVARHRQRDAPEHERHRARPQRRLQAEHEAVDRVRDPPHPGGRHEQQPRLGEGRRRARADELDAPQPQVAARAERLERRHQPVDERVGQERQRDEHHPRERARQQRRERPGPQAPAHPRHAERQERRGEHRPQERQADEDACERQARGDDERDQRQQQRVGMRAAARGRLDVLGHGPPVGRARRRGSGRTHGVPTASGW